MVTTDSEPHRIFTTVSYYSVDFRLTHVQIAVHDMTKCYFDNMYYGLCCCRYVCILLCLTFSCFFRRHALIATTTCYMSPSKQDSHLLPGHTASAAASTPKPTEPDQAQHFRADGSSHKVRALLGTSTAFPRRKSEFTPTETRPGMLMYGMPGVIDYTESDSLTIAAHNCVHARRSCFEKWRT